jgi:hypothetical protein
LRRFWGVAPVEGSGPQPSWLRMGVAGFYLSQFAAAALGLLVVARSWSVRWIPPLLMVGAFMGVHLIYWTNTRMRAPIEPVIAVLAAVGACRAWSAIRPDDARGISSRGGP